MIKGINKQIIEIKCTESEHFDKILLFVKGKSCAFPKEFLARQGVSLVRNITGNDSEKNQLRKGKIAAFAACILAAAAVLLMLAVII